MNKYAALVVSGIIGLLIGGSLHFILPSQKKEMEAMQTNDAGHSSSMMHGHETVKHEQLEVTNTQNPPRVKIDLQQDALSGWNLHIQTENFTFAPEHAGLEHIDGEGHAHLYIDGVKIARLYGEWFHIPDFSIGQHVIQVSLNSNNHQELSLNGSPIRAEQIINVLK